MRVMPPPMNTCDGLKKLTIEASIWPIRLPARCTIALAAASPARLAWPTSIGVDAAVAAQALRQRGALAGLRPPRIAIARDRRAGRHRLDAAQVAAMAARAVLVDADVADVAGRAGGAAVHLAMADDAAADAGADLDAQEVRERALSRHSSPSAIRLTSLSTNTGAA